MKKTILAAVALASVASLHANADVLGATAGVDFWYADAKINDIRADDASFQQSVSLAFEHPIPLIPNAKIRYTGVKSSKSNTDFDQYDLIAYYEILDNDLLRLDVGVNLQHFNGNFVNQHFSEWQPNLYATGAVGVPVLPLAIFGTFSFGEYDGTSTVDAEAGLALELIDFLPVSLDIKAGYRIIDHDFNYFNNTKSRIINDGFFFGVELDI